MATYLLDVNEVFADKDDLVAEPMPNLGVQYPLDDWTMNNSLRVNADRLCWTFAALRVHHFRISLSSWGLGSLDLESEVHNSYCRDRVVINRSELSRWTTGRSRAL